MITRDGTLMITRGGYCNYYAGQGVYSHDDD